jgi:hypothetical protein
LVNTTEKLVISEYHLINKYIKHKFLLPFGRQTFYFEVYI